MLLITSDGREFSLTDSEYERFLVKFGECELIEVDDEEYAGNMHCDTYGVCGGTSCPNYHKCH